MKWKVAHSGTAQQYNLMRLQMSLVKYIIEMSWNVQCSNFRTLLSMDICALPHAKFSPVWVNVHIMRCGQGMNGNIFKFVKLFYE